MRVLAVACFIWAMLASWALADDKDATHTVRHAEVGKVLILDFPGNRSMAHRWRLVEERSSGLELVSVDPLGWIVAESGSYFYGNQDTMRYRVIPKARGQADLIFEHNYKSWNQKHYFTWKTVRLIIGPPPEKKQ